ncbi:MAG: hypothetical protein AB7P02_02220 [Alphaproteobacteria bacterium]
MTGTLLHILEGIVAVLIPIIVTTVVAEIVDALKPRQYHEIPALRRTALLSGVLLPPAVLWATPDTGIYALDLIFPADGPWAIDLREMLTERFLPYFQVLPEVYVGSYDAPLWVRALVSMHALLVLTTLLLPFRLWRLRQALRAAFCDALIVVVSTTLTLYMICTVYWLLNQLTVWVIAVAGLLFQRFRLQRARQAGH